MLHYLWPCMANCKINRIMMWGLLFNTTVPWWRTLGRFECFECFDQEEIRAVAHCDVPNETTCAGCHGLLSGLDHGSMCPNCLFSFRIIVGPHHAQQRPHLLLLY